MVFARYIAFILSTYLGKFIKGLNNNSVNFSLLRGSFELKNVELASDLLSFSEHFQLENGTIGSLSVNIPWRALYSRRCEVVIRDVFIVVIPKYNESTGSSSFFKSEEEFLASIQAILADESKEVKAEKEPKSGFLHRLRQTILKNLAFRLENVSIQLEDKSGCWQGCSAGVKARIGKLSCEATNAEFSPTFIRPEEQTTAETSLYRLISYENAAVELFYVEANVNQSSTSDSKSLCRSSSADSSIQFEEALFSSSGTLALAWDNNQAPEHHNPSLALTLVIGKSSASWNPYCIVALGILFESIRQVPQRAFAWNRRPENRLCRGDVRAATKWWHYSVLKVVERQKAARERSRFRWDNFLQRKEFLSNLFYYCLILLKAPWLPGGLEVSVCEKKLSCTPVHDVMTCWNAARWYVKQYEEHNQAPQGTLYTQYLQYYCLHANNRNDRRNCSVNQLLAYMDVNLTIECTQLTTKLDYNLRSLLTRCFMKASKKNEGVDAQLSVSSVTIVTENIKDSPLLSINGDNGAASALLSVSKIGSAPINGQLSFEAVTACLDFSFQELLFSKVVSYITAVEPFLHQRFTKSKSKPAKLQDTPKTLEPKELLFSHFDLAAKSIVASADGVSINIQKVETALAPHAPIAVKVQEIVVTVNDTSLVQLCCIATTTALSKECITVGVDTNSATVSTDVESFEYVKLLLSAIARRWKREVDNVVAEAKSFFALAEESTLVEKDHKNRPVKIALHFDFIGCDALALDAFKIHVTLSDGWHIHLGAAGGTTEGWCHSAPRHAQDPFIDIDIWADAYLQESPFAGNIENNGIGFLLTLNHVTLCLGDELAATAEALFDVIILIIFGDEDRHVHLRNDRLYTTPHISGRLVGSDVKLILESDGGDVTLLPGYAAAMKEDEASRKAFVIPVPPMPLVVELLGKDCIDITLHRYGDKRMDVAVALQNGVNAFLRGTPAYIPLLPSREGTRAEINLHLTAPSEADLPVFPYSRIDILLKLYDAAVVAHIPTIMALWTNFNTPSLPLGRLRNVGNRVHFISRPSRSDKTLPPRSPASMALEAVGAAALAQSSPFTKAAEKSDSTMATAFLEPSPVYTTSVFPSDMTLRVEVVHSELYYPWGEGSVAPLFLHAVVPKCDVSVLNRDECVEVSVRGVMQMPSVAASFHVSPASRQVRPAEESEKGSGEVTDGGSAGTACVNDVKNSQAAEAENRRTDDADFLSNHTSNLPEQSASAGSIAAERHPPNTKADEADINALPTLSAFSGDVKDRPHSSDIQVHVTYTMDSRPPYRPGSSNETFFTFLSGTLPGPLHICLRDPVEVGAWLTFFTYFNPTNTIPLSTSNAAFFPIASAFTNNNNSKISSRRSEEAAQSHAAEVLINSGSTRCLKTLVQLAPIVFRLPFAGAAAVLRDGVEFSASPGYNAFRIPQLEVIVHKDLLDGSPRLRGAGRDSYLDELLALRDDGYSVLSLRGTSENGSRGLAAVPGVLLETRQKGPSAADVSRRLVIPVLQGQVCEKTTLVQLQCCASLAAIERVFSARNAQCALLDAVIQRESLQLGLQYACCLSPQADGVTKAQVQAQLRPFISLPMVILFQNACFTYEWESGLQRDVRAGLTIALHNLRCNDYETYNRAESQRGTSVAVGSGGDSADSSSGHRCNDSTPFYKLSPSMPFLVDVSSTDAYVWWTSVDSNLAAPVPRENAQGPGTAPSFRIARNMDDKDEWTKEMGRSAKGERRPASLSSSIGTYMPLLLYPVCVRTSISSVTPAVTGEVENDGSTASKDATKPNRVSATYNQSSQTVRTLPTASTASFHTMPSTSDDSPVMTAAAPTSPLYATDVAVAPVIEVSPVHVILSTSAYVVLSDVLMRKYCDENRANTSAEPPSPPAHVPNTYTLVRREVRKPHQENGSSLSPSSSSVSQPPPPQRWSHHNCGSKPPSDPEHESGSEVAHAQAATNGKSLYVYRFDSAEKSLWVKKIELGRSAQVVGQHAARGARRTASTSSFFATVENPENSEACDGVSVIPLSRVHTADRLLSSAVNVPSVPVAAPGTENSGVPNAPHIQSSPMPPKHQTSVHTSLALPCDPTTEAVPRLQRRVIVTELCIRLVLFEDLESAFSTIAEARSFWQRHTAVHTAADGDPPALSMPTVLAAAVPALHALLRTSKHSSAWSRGSSATNPNRQRVVEPPALASLLEEKGVDSLCIHLCGIVVSDFTDARSIVIDSCVCTSVRSPSRPLLAVMQAELYLPTSSVTYPSMAAAARASARNLESVAGRCGGQSGVGGMNTHVSPTAATSQQSQLTSNSPTVAADDPRKTAAAPSFSSRIDSSFLLCQGTGKAAGMEGGQEKQESEYPSHIHTTAGNRAPLGNTHPSGVAHSISTGRTASESGGRNGQRVVLMGEVGCRVDSITVDISATALRAWLSSLVEQPVVALRAAAEKKKQWVVFSGTHAAIGNGAEDSLNATGGGIAESDDSAKKEEPVVPNSLPTEPLSLLRWQPGHGLRIYEARDAIWSLEHDIILSRNGLVLAFTSHNTNLMTVMLNSHSIILDEALLLQPVGLSRTVMVIQGGLTVRFVGSGRVQLPLGLWSPSSWDSKGNIGVEAVLLPFMAIGEGSYLECINVQLGFSEETSASVKASEATATVAPPPSLPLRVTAKSEGTEALKKTAGRPAAHPTQAPTPRASLTHRSVHLVLPRVSLIVEPRQESRQVHISAAVELWVSVCGGVLLRDDLRCTGLAISTESVYDTATTTSRTAVLAPVDVSMCSDNGRHHAVSLGSTQVDLGRAELLLLSTYMGELRAMRSYAKYLTHSRVEKEFLELVEKTLAWKVAARVDALTAEQDDDEEDENTEEDSDVDEQEKDTQENSIETVQNERGAPAEQDSPPSQRSSTIRRCPGGGGERPRIGPNEGLQKMEETAATSPLQSPEVSRQNSEHWATASPIAALWDSVTSRKGGKGKGNTVETADKTPEKREMASTMNNDPTQAHEANTKKEQSDGQTREQRQQKIRRHQRRQTPSHPHRFSWAIFTPAIEFTVSGHHYPILQLCVQDVMLRRASTSALATTSFLQCQKASVQVYGRGRWDVVLLPSAAVTWSFTQSVSRHSSNRHVLLNVEGIHVLCSHLIVAKLLYLTRQLKTLSNTLRRRLSVVAAAQEGGNAPTAVNLSAPPNADGDAVELLSRLDSQPPSQMVSNKSSSGSLNDDDNNGNASNSSISTDTSTADDDKSLSRRRACAELTAAATSAPGGGAVTAGIATHRLLNSFRYTLFAGICEREAVTAIAGTPPFSIPPHDVVQEEKSQGPGEVVPTVWRCKELYRLPPVSATDIFISYRRARSLVLTFFSTGCVEWDESAGLWVLSANGETELAARAVEAMRRPPAAPPRDVDGAHELNSELSAHATVNWFPFTMLQYGMARPVAVRATTRMESSRPATLGGGNDSNASSSNTVGGLATTANDVNNNSGCVIGGRALNARSLRLGTVGNADYSNYEIHSYALALTCVDPEEEAESLRYPIVVAPDEARITPDTERCSSDGGSGGGRQRCGGGSSEASRRASSALSRRTSSGYGDAADFSLGDSQQDIRHSAVKTDSGGANSANPIPSSSAVLPAAAVAKLHAAYRHRKHNGRGITAANDDDEVVPNSATRRMAGQDHVHDATGSMTANDSGDGDLLVVRLQARCSLLNETGCTLQLCSLTPPTTAEPTNNTAGEAAESVTVPPGWRLPLGTEDVRHEVLLRVYCPSTRWVPTTTALSPGSNTPAPDEGVTDNGDALGGTLADRWYEARLVLGDLDSGRFLSLQKVAQVSQRNSDAAVPGIATADVDAFEDQDKRPLILFVVIHFSSSNLIEHISLYPRLTLVNHLGVSVRVAVFQQDPAAGPQTPDEAMLLAPWTAPYVGRRRHERERFHRSLVALGSHDALQHQHALPLHFCTYGSNLVLGLSFSQSTGDALITTDLEPVVSFLREAVDHHPRMLLMHDSHGRTFFVQVSVMPRTVVLSVALWVYNLTEYPLLLCDSVVTRRLCPGQSSTTGIIPSQGEPFLIGCRLSDFTQGFFAIGLDGGWSGAVPIDVGSTGVFVSAQSQLGIQRSCNYSILFPNAQEGRPVVLQITPRWVFYNNTQKRLRIHFRFPGMAKALHEAEKKQQQHQQQQLLLIKQEAARRAARSADGNGVETSSTKRDQILRQTDDNVSTLTSLATVQLNPRDYHVSCIGPIEGNQFSVQDVLEGVLPTITSMAKGSSKVVHRDVAAYYESHLTPYMDVDRPGEATFNLWAAPRAPGKRVAVSYGGELLVQRPVFPHPTWLEPYDVFATDAVITGRIAVEVQNSENVLVVLLQSIQGTKILLQNRTARNTVMVRQQGSRRRNCIPPRQNRFFLWEDARQEHMIRVHLLGFKGRWFDVDFSSGECQVTYHEDSKAAAEAEALAAAQRAHPWPTNVKSDDTPRTPFTFAVHGYANLEKTRVTIIVTESAIPLYASIDAWRTSVAHSLQVSMVRVSWIQEVSAGVETVMSPATPLGAAAAGVDADGAVMVVDTDVARRNSNRMNSSNTAGGEGGTLRQTPLTSNRSSATRRRHRSAFGVSHSGEVLIAAGSNRFTASPLLFSAVLEGVQLERLSTEDTETFFFAIHQMQWIDEKLDSVFVYRARPRLPPVAPVNDAATSTASPHSSLSSNVSPPHSASRRFAPFSPPASSSIRWERSAMLLPRAAMAATAAANRVWGTVFGIHDASLLSMEKQNDLELSYNLIKYADGVTRFTELRCVLTPLVVILSDFWLADTIHEVRRLRVLLGLRKQAATIQTTTTTTVPIIMLAAPAPQQQSQSKQRPPPSQVSPVDGIGSNVDADGTVLVVRKAMDDGGARQDTQTGGSALSWLSARMRSRSDRNIVIEAGNDYTTTTAVAVPPSTLSLTVPPVQQQGDATTRLRNGLLSRQQQRYNGHSSSNSSSDTEATASSHSSAQGHTHTAIRRSRRALTTLRGSSKSSSDTAPRHIIPTSQTANQLPSFPVKTAAPPPRKSIARRSRVKTSGTQPQQQQGSANSATSTTGFVSQCVFLHQLVQEVRVRLQRQDTSIMAGSLAAIVTPEGKSGKPGGLLNPLRGVGGLVGGGGGNGSVSGGQRRQLVATTVRHRRGALQRGSAGDELAGTAVTTTMTTSADMMEGANGMAGTTGVDGALTATMPAGSNVNAASVMFIERLEVQRVTLYITFLRHRPDPLRPILGAYAWMLPSHLNQREFYLPAWTLTQQVETPASLRARLTKWGVQSLREQWTKVTKLGTLLDALKFWQHRMLRLHGPPQTLTLAAVQQQRQQQAGKPISFAPCVSSGEDGEEEDEEGEREENGEAPRLSGRNGVPMLSTFPAA